MKLAPGERWKVEDANGVRFVWIKTFPYQRNNWRRVLNMVSYMLWAWWLGRRLPKLSPEIEKPDVIIGSSVHLLAVLAAYWVAKRHRARFIMEVRDLWPQTIIDMGEMSGRNPIVKTLQFLERFLYRRAERIITLLPLAHEHITSCGVPQEKIVWIPNGVDLSRFEGVKPRGMSNGEFRVMYLGAHGQANAIDVLLQAAKIVQDRGYQEIQFILIGDGPEKPRLIKLGRELKLRNVEFRDPVPKSKVPKVLKEADATVFILNDLSLYRYGISLNKLYDYLAAGRPAILAGNPVNNPVREVDCGLTVPPRNPEALANAIIELSRMPKEEREAMGRRGREYVEKYHSIPALADKLIACIEQVAKQ
jgi:glycosyltransferase involved in cell wall biosynthesis